MKTEQQKPKWIEVASEVPDDDKDVLIYMKETNETHSAVSVGHLRMGRWFDYAASYDLPTDCVTHWMPLPEPPNEKEKS